ncbi:hypothetical protein MRS44_014806 [Fusarium solani]|uniref:uncharacterized protein n=1 Tax=Fusarium solani TaxID=169388 RepID=UPI0032C48FBA|nr:hypothetical protein MRS44_014806 [Fusarium solani]
MDGCERGGWTFFPFCGWHGIQGWGMGVIREVLLSPSSITITTTEPAENNKSNKPAAKRTVSSGTTTSGQSTKSTKRARSPSSARSPSPSPKKFCAEKKTAALTKAHEAMAESKRLHTLSLKLADDAAMWAAREEEHRQAESSEGSVMARFEQSLAREKARRDQEKEAETKDVEVEADKAEA